jgi:hypothetical protein
MIKQYFKKLETAGKIATLYEYFKPHFIGLTKFKKHSRAIEDTKTGKLKKNHRSFSSDYRARKKITGIINANPILQKFITLTIAENQQNLNIANHQFKKFIQRCVWKYPDFKYCAVVEFQKRGAIHYHLACSLPYIDKIWLEKCWGLGFTQIRRTRNVKDLGAYFSKHGTKRAYANEIEYVKENEALAGRKKFFHSKDLKMPIVSFDDWEIDALIATELTRAELLRTADFKMKGVNDNSITKYSVYRLQ